MRRLRGRYEQLGLLYQTAKSIHSTLDPQETLQIVLDEALRGVHADAGLLALVHPTRELLDVQAVRNLPSVERGTPLPLGRGIIGRVARSGKAVCVAGISRESLFYGMRPAMRAELGVPLDVNGEVRGVISLATSRPGGFTGADQRLVGEIAILGAKAIYNTWIYEQFRLKASLFESLASVSQIINSTHGLDEVLGVVTREACGLMKAKMCSLMLLDATGEWLELRASYGAGPAYTNKPRLSVGESLLGVVVRRRRPVQEQNVQTSSRYQHVEVARQEGLVSLLSVPLLFSGRAIGALSVYTGSPYTFSNEEIRILCALADLSAIAIEKARLYERIVEVEEKLRQSEKLSALGLLAAEVAHEIRNPLTVMKMLYHSLDLKFPENDPRARDAEMLGRKIEHLNRIVERILALARTSEPCPKPLDVNRLIDELALLVRHKLKQQNIELVRNLHPALPLVTGDATQLEQAFLNLTLNAIEAMPKGGTLTISTGLVGEEAGGSVLIEFEDTGEGMTEERRRQAFSSVLQTSRPGGTGLGLAIVRRVVEAHRGRLEIKTRPGCGTTVSIELPL